MNGFVAINKKCGISSSDVVIKCRNAYSKCINTKIKCGHMGTLDPAASGILVLGFGKATRLFDLMQKHNKTYIADIIFGEETDTLDREGCIINTSELPNVKDLDVIITSFIGDIYQIPPKYCALSINGKRCYDLARSGIDIDLKARKVSIYDIKLIDLIEDKGLCKSIKIKVSCSSGTYIRSLVRDISYKLGVVGYMSALDRISSGVFNKDNSVDMTEFINNPSKYVIPCINILSQYMPIIEVDKKNRKQIINGVKCDLGIEIPKLSCLTIDNKVFGIAETINNQTKSIINLWEE